MREIKPASFFLVGQFPLNTSIKDYSNQTMLAPVRVENVWDHLKS